MEDFFYKIRHKGAIWKKQIPIGVISEKSEINIGSQNSEKERLCLKAGRRRQADCHCRQPPPSQPKDRRATEGHRRQADRRCRILEKKLPDHKRYFKKG